MCSVGECIMQVVTDAVAQSQSSGVLSKRALASLSHSSIHGQQEGVSGEVTWVLENGVKSMNHNQSNRLVTEVRAVEKPIGVLPSSKECFMHQRRLGRHGAPGQWLGAFGSAPRVRRIDTDRRARGRQGLNRIVLAQGNAPRRAGQAKGPGHRRGPVCAARFQPKDLGDAGLFLCLFLRGAPTRRQVACHSRRQRGGGGGPIHFLAAAHSCTCAGQLGPKGALGELRLLPLPPLLLEPGALLGGLLIKPLQERSGRLWSLGGLLAASPKALGGRVVALGALGRSSWRQNVEAAFLSTCEPGGGKERADEKSTAGGQIRKGSRARCEIFRAAPHSLTNTYNPRSPCRAFARVG